MGLGIMAMKALAVFLAAANAHPVVELSDTPTGTTDALVPRGLVSRAVPVPYPGPSGACVNEFKYLNFDMSETFGDAKRVDLLHYAFCNEFGILAAWALNTINLDDRTVYKRWFFDNNQIRPREYEKIESVFEKIWDPTTKQATAVTSNFILDKVDFAGKCGATSVIAGYQTVDVNGDQREKIHFCDRAFQAPKLKDITCLSLDRYPSYKMETLGAFMLHEFTHYSTVGPASDVKRPIIDALNKDGLPAYDAERAHALVSEAPNLTEVNADNYAYLAMNAFFTGKCKKDFDDPLMYTPNVP